MRAVFLVEKDTGRQNSLVMDAHIESDKDEESEDHVTPINVAIPISTGGTHVTHDLPTPTASPDGRLSPKHGGGMVKEYVEMWDYVGGTRFRGFVTEQVDNSSTDERAMFVFFDAQVLGKDLKPGLMALLELASSDFFACTQLVVCLDRSAADEDVKDSIRDLGWVGFEMTMLDEWAGGEQGCMSDRWIYLSIDV